MSAIENRKPLFFIQFAGQGVNYIDEIRLLYSTCPDIVPFIRNGVKVMKEQLSMYDDSHSRFFEQGIDLISWIERPETTPGLGYLLSSPVSQPMVYLCQIANYISIIQQGVDQEKLLRHTHSATGFSTGSAAAIVVSMNLPMDELWSMALKVLGMFFWEGVHSEQAMLNFGVRAKLEDESLKDKGGSPSCMASVSKLDDERFADILKSFSEYEVAHPAYKLAPGRRIISGFPQSMIAFQRFLKDKAPEARMKFIPSTIAAHCPHMAWAAKASAKDAARLGVNFRGEDMKIPVWSNDTGEDLRLRDNITADVITSYAIYEGLWGKQVSSIKRSGVNYVLDFGPGTGVATLTEGYVSGSGIEVIRCSVPLGRAMLFKKILPLIDQA